MCFAGAWRKLGRLATALVSVRGQDGRDLPPSCAPHPCSASPLPRFPHLRVPHSGKRQDNRAASRPGSMHQKGYRFFADDEDVYGLEDMLQARGACSLLC